MSKNPLVVYKASAGSGKTYTLVLEYLKALLGFKDSPEANSSYHLNHKDFNSEKKYKSNNHRHILAITFTNKATEEMKNRILEKLNVLAYNTSESDYCDALMTHFGCSEKQLSETSQLAFRDLLTDYQYFNVSTIDSFFQQILRVFAYELDRQGDYSIEIQNTHAIVGAITDLIDEFNDLKNEAEFEKHPVGVWMKNLMRETSATSSRVLKLGVFNRNNIINDGLLNYVKSIYEEDFDKYRADFFDWLDNNNPDDVAKQLSDKQRVNGQMVETGVMADIKNRIRQKYNDEIHQKLAPYGIDFARDHTSCAFFEMLKECRYPSKSTGTAPFKNCAAGRQSAVKILVKDKKSKISASKVLKGGGDPDTIISECQQSLYELVQLYSELFFIEHLRESIKNMAMLKRVDERLKDFRDVNNMLFLNDTNKLIQRIIDGAELPFIFERMGLQLTHFLIDEFQDTSTMQWANLRPLVDNGISEFNDSLIIGDVKQSIYRFRNANSDLLNKDVEKGYNDNGQNYLYELKGFLPEENTNWRSAADIIRFNNSLFKQLAKDLNVPGYGNVVQAISKKHLDLSSYIRFIPFLDGEAVSVDNSTVANESDNDSEENDDISLGVIDEWERLAAEIRAERERGYDFKEITILCRKNDYVAKIVGYLKSHHADIPLASAEALQVSFSSAVHTVVGVLRLLKDYYSRTADRQNLSASDKTVTQAQRATSSKKEISLIAARFHLLVNEALSKRGEGQPDSRQVSEDELNEIREDALIKAVSESSSLDTLVDLVSDISHKNSTTLVSLIELIISKFITDKQKSEEMGYLTAFVDYVINYVEKYDSTITGFLKWYDLNIQNLTVASSADVDAVNVMTIHKSKGLERACVHLVLEKSATFDGKGFSGWIETPPCNDPIVQQQLDRIGLSPVVHIEEIKKEDAQELNDKKQEHLEASHADELNAMYVAMTRACRELTVYYDVKCKIVGAMRNAISTFEPDEEDEDRVMSFSEDDINDFLETDELTIGEPTYKIIESGSDADKSTAPDFDWLPDRGDLVSLNKDNINNIDRYSKGLNKGLQALFSLDTIGDGVPYEEDFEDNPDEGTKKPRREQTPDEKRGTRLHNVMMFLRRMDIDSDDVEMVISDAAKKAAGRYHYNDDELSECVSVLTDIVTSLMPEDKTYIRRWFRDYDKVAVEQPIYISNQLDVIEFGEIRRLDRLVYNADGTIDIVDYKFGSQNSASNRDQVREYIDQVRALLPDRQIRGYLWFLEQNQIVQV